MACLTLKRSQLFLFVLSLLVLSGAFYFEYVDDMQPCPLCLMQRLCVFFVCLFAGFSLLVKRITAKKVFVWTQLLFIAAGLFFATRQLWLQSLPPDETPTCMPELNVMLKYFPWSAILRAFFWGASDCGEIIWTWLGLSLAAWSASYFVIAFLLCLLFFSYLRKQSAKLY